MFYSATLKLLFSYLPLCWFRNDPVDLHPSRSFMWQAVAFYLVSGIIVESMIADPADGSLEVALRTIMAFSSVASLLWLEKKWAYFSQLYIAIFVCENFIMTWAIAAEALDFWMVLHHHPQREVISISIAVVLVVWYISIVAYIFRKFFAYRTLKSLLLAFSYFVLTYGLPMLFMDI
jgi:hypothetical protein